MTLSPISQCLVEPQRAQYGGGIIVNPDFNQGLEGWTAYGQGEIEERISEAGNMFIVAHSRTHSLDSLSQKVQLEKAQLYSFSGNHVYLAVGLKKKFFKKLKGIRIFLCIKLRPNLFYSKRMINVP